MNAPAAETRHLGPGSEQPHWVERLETASFGSPWGPLEEDDHLWLAGAAGFARWRLIPPVQEAELIRIAVLPEHRRHGLGRDLLRVSEANLARMGIRVFFLEVRVSNVAARTLYVQEGWTFEGVRKAYYRDGEDAALYRRDLA